MAVSNKDLALAIIQFLNNSVANKTINEEFSESVDVAIDCIADAFEVDKSEAVSALGGKSLLDVVNGANSTTKTSSDNKPEEVDEETKAMANTLKAEGNKAMAVKDFDTAIAKYTDAITLDPSNVVFLSNRAAAYSSSSQHAKAVEDAKAAIALDPKFSKAYSRLGLAEYALGNAKGSMEAYKSGLEVEGSLPSDAMKRGFETARKRVEEDLESSMSEGDKNASVSAKSTNEDASSDSKTAAGGLPDFSSMFGGGAGGMPSLAEMMNNPQVMQAAQSLMSNPDAMQGLMNNPMLRQMALGLGGGAGLEGLMNNPALQDMAKLFMGGQEKKPDAE